MEFSQLVSEIKEKVRQLKMRVQRLEKENAELKTSVFAYLEKIETQKAEMEKLKQELHTGHINANMSIDKKKIQKDIDKYIVMIDKCIANVKTSI